MRRSLPLLASLVLAAGCRTILGIDEASVAADAPPVEDAPLDAAPCFGKQPFEICLTTLPSTPLAFDFGQVINTDVDCPVMHLQGAALWCVYPATDIVIRARVTATGSFPLVLLATGALRIFPTGSVDVSSKPAQMGGAGAGSRGFACQAGTPAINRSAGAGGGAGGSFGSPGGNGGPGDLGVGPAGIAGPALNPVTELRGGCPGTVGGMGGTTAASIPGDGGGAVYLLGGALLEIDGIINASGAGGGGGPPARSGGAGGGSGGLILLWTPAILVGPSGQVFANGGGGGGGASTGNPGLAGAQSTGAEPPALGGAPPGTTIGRGGAGSSQMAGGSVGGMDTSGAGGGGGGGGGGGMIRVLSGQTLNPDNISPVPTSL